jgi:hypothetical protein
MWCHWSCYYSQDKIRTYLDNMVAGRINTFPVSAKPVFDSEVQCLTAEELLNSGGSDDFGKNFFLQHICVHCSVKLGMDVWCVLMKGCRKRCCTIEHDAFVGRLLITVDVVRCK